MKPLLVGEANPYGGDPSFALYPDPPGCAGHRLCHKVMALDPGEYLERFDRVNLCPTAWSVKRARIEAAAVRGRVAGQATAVLLGARVCAAFDVAFRPFTLVGDRTPLVDAWAPVFVVLPHPSGLSRVWNEPGAYERARAVLREAGVLS